MNNDYAAEDRQAFLNPPRPQWVDTVVGYVVTALLGAVLALVLVWGRYGN